MTQRVDIPSLGFSPIDGDLVNILSNRIKKGMPYPYITDTETLYEKEPWLLQHVRHVNFKDNEWFYFVTRKRRLDVINHDAITPSRKVVGSSGRWKSNASLSNINNKDGVTTGCEQQIAFVVKKQETEKATGWVMHEFRLNEPGFQQVVLCRIRFNKRKNNAQYAPILEPIVIGQPREDCLALVEYNNNNDLHDAILVQETQYLDAPVETQQGIIYGSFSQYLVDATMGQNSNYSIFNGGMMNQHQEINGDELGSLLAQTIFTTSDFFMETQPGVEPQQQYHNLVGGLAFEQQHLEQVPNLSLTQQLDLTTVLMETQQQETDIGQQAIEGQAMEEEQAMEEGINEESLGAEADIGYEEFRNEEWAQKYGVNTPEEEAELMAISSTLDAFINYFPGT